MKNTKSALNLLVMTSLGLTFGLLTACGGSSSSNEVVTSLPNCTTSSIYNEGSKTWTLSNTDVRECQAITTVSTNVTCSSNEVKVRIPITSNTTSSVTTSNSANTCIQQTNGAVVCGTPTNNNFNVNGNNNYHTTSGSYNETCVNQNSQDWYYIVNAGSYYYLDYNQAYNQYQDYQYQYQYSYNKELSPKETIITFGVLAAALFFLNK